MSQHIFAVYHAAPLSSKTNLITIRNEEIFHRVRRVLHLDTNDKLILFDAMYAYTCLIEAVYDKTNTLELIIQNQSPIQEYSPRIHLYCCIAKREAFEEIAYAAGQLGVATVHPIISNKIHRNWIEQKDLVRLEKIAVAGCEQAKQFCIPVIHLPKSFEALMSIKNLLVAEELDRPHFKHSLLSKRPQEK